MSQSQPDSPELEVPEVTGDPAVDFLNKRDADRANAQVEGAEAPEEVDAVEPEEETEEAAETEAAAPDAEDLAWLQKKRTISVNGRETEITADEAFKGYQFEAYARQQTERAAELTRQAEQERQAVQKEREYHANQLETFANAMHLELVGDESRLPELLETDPHA